MKNVMEAFTNKHLTQLLAGIVMMFPTGDNAHAAPDQTKVEPLKEQLEESASEDFDANTRAQIERLTPEVLEAHVRSMEKFEEFLANGLLIMNIEQSVLSKKRKEIQNDSKKTEKEKVKEIGEIDKQSEILFKKYNQEVRSIGRLTLLIQMHKHQISILESKK